MENIINLVKNLHTGEIKLLRHFYKYQEDKDSKKINLLFDFAVKSKNCKNTDEVEKKALEVLYGNDRKFEGTFARLKLRLKNDIFNILLLQASSIKTRSKHDMAIFDCRRMLIQGEILLDRGIYQEGINILEKASSIARKNELFAEQVLIDELCRNYNSLKSGEDLFMGFMKSIETNTSLLEKVQYAKYFHYEVTAALLFKTAETKPLQEWKNKLDTVCKDYEQTQSVKIGFYYHLSAINYHREINDLKKSLEFAEALHKLSQFHEILKTPFYSGKINMELAKCYLLTENYDKAIAHATISNGHLQKDALNELAVLEILLHSYLMKQDYKKVKSVFETAFIKASMQPDEFIQSKWCFLKAGIEFRMNEHATALKSLKECSVLLKDKNGWLLAYNIFEAICRIENGHLEWLEYRSEAFRKMMLRYNKDKAGHQKNRFDLIYKILRTLHKNNYDYVQTLEEERERLERLSETSHANSWFMSGYEPIPFENWIKEKAASQLKNKKAKSKLVA